MSRPAPLVIPEAIAWVLRQHAAAHATRARPEEFCGLLVQRAGELMVIPCRNILAGSETDRFAIAPEEWAAAEDGGDVLAVVHSHLGPSAEASALDLAEMERTGLPWLIVAAEGGQLLQYTPTRPLPHLVGRSFELGRTDCYTLIRDWFAEQLGITLPDWPRGEFWTLATGTPGADLYREHFAEAGFVLLGSPARIEPSRGDVLLMRVQMPEGDHRPNHAAVCVGGNRILQHLARRISGHAPWARWQRAATHVLRHKSLLT